MPLVQPLGGRDRAYQATGAILDFRELFRQVSGDETILRAKKPFFTFCAELRKRRMDIKAQPNG
jgi:hypothetical protein